MHIAPGGPATNAAITHALLGGNAVLVTAIGGGPWAGPVRDELRQLGVGVIELAKGTSYETPMTAVLANQANATRTIVNPPVCDVELGRVHAWDAAWGDVPNLVLADGFHILSILPLLQDLRKLGTQICLDGGSWKAGTEELATLLSVAICSERFAVSGRSADPDATIGWFAEKGVAHIAITRGAKPILASDRGRRFEIEIAKIDAVDTTGAGDVLHGAFCYHFARTGEFESSLRLAAEIATRSCRDAGIRGWELNR